MRQLPIPAIRRPISYRICISHWESRPTVYLYEGFVRNLMRDPGMVILKDPLAVIDWPHQTLDAKNNICREQDYVAFERP